MRNLTVTIVLLISTFTQAQENIVYETKWIQREEMSEIFRNMKGNRLLPCKIDGRLNGIEIEYKASYCPFPKGMISYYTRWGMSDEWYSYYGSEYGENFKEYYHSTFSDLAGSTIHQVTWMLMSE